MRYSGNKRTKKDKKLFNTQMKNNKHLSNKPQAGENNQLYNTPALKGAKYRKWIAFFVLLAVACMMFFMAVNVAHIKQGDEQTKGQTLFYHETVIAKTTGEKIVFDTQIADTPQKSMKGLMFYKSLPENQGMLFISPYDQIWTMWMKNTYIPLDMIYFKRNGEIVKIIKNARPHDLTHLSSGMPVAGVLEVGGGVADKFNITVGDILLNEWINK